MSFLSNLFGRNAKRIPRRVPDGVWAAAIGDIHGQLDALNRLLALLERRAAQSRSRRKILIFVGDYIDRGFKSKQVIDRLVAGIPGFECVFLRGNHDQTLLEFLDDPTVAEAWRNYGGLETLASYGVAKVTQGDWPRIQQDLRVALPDSHLQFMRALKMHFTLGDYLFVHAGLRPGVPLHAQADHDLMWIRDDFLNASADFGALVVHGHTPKEKPDIRPNRIGIDTHAYLSGVLTALVLEEDRQSFVTSRDAV